MRRNRTITMTEGSLYKNILLFTLPLIASNLLQVLFNMSDIAVVGHFAGAYALGAVGSCSITVTLFVGLLMGMGGGVNAVAARFMGAKDRDNIAATVHTSFIICAAYGLIIMTAGLFAARGILILLGTKEELLDDAVLYLRVYLLGTPAMAVYNFGNGTLSAAGDSKRPLYYLLTAGILNVILNLIFVIGFRLGVLGVAMASAMSQYVSCILIMRRLLTCGEVYGLDVPKLRINRFIAASVISIGIPTGLQYAIFAIANLFVQASVNTFDTIMVAANSAATNSDALVYDMMAAFYVACTSFIGQNLGAGNRERVMQSFKISVMYSFLIAVLFGGALVIFGRPFLRIFTSDELVVEKGLMRLYVMSCSYCLSAFMDCTIAASRGIGKTVVPMIMVILGSCIFRIIWIYTVFAHFHTIVSLYLLYAFSWVITSVMEIWYFVYACKKVFSEEVFDYRR